MIHLNLSVYNLSQFDKAPSVLRKVTLMYKVSGPASLMQEPMNQDAAALFTELKWVLFITEYLSHQKLLEVNLDIVKI